MRCVHGTTASLVAFVFLITVTSAVLRADDAAASAPQAVADGETGILLLHDGGVLTGKVTRAADWYVVARGAGQMQVAQSRVQLVCRTLEEAYEFKRQQIVGDKTADHLKLAEWCIRYDLRTEAGQELAEARRLEPDQPRLALLERRLEKGSARPVVKQSVYLEAANSKGKPQAAGMTPVGGATPAAPATPASDLPSGALELFTRKVQPVLVNNCTTSGCHTLGSKQSFQLDRAILRGESNRRSTAHNLDAALALVDRLHPDQSLLLTVPRKTHGGTSGPVFGPRQDQAFKHLVDWVALVVPTEPPKPVAEVAPKAIEEIAGALPIQSAATAEGDAPAVSRVQSHRQPIVRAAALAADDDPTKSLRPPHRLQVGAQLKSWQPRDAFDPEIFNRAQQARAHGNQPAAQSIPAAAGATTAEQR